MQPLLTSTSIPPAASGAFLVAVQPGSGSGSGTDQIVGYVCGTCTTSTSLTHDSMSTHESNGALLCVHSVCVAEAHWRKGIASRCVGPSWVLEAFQNFGLKVFDVMACIANGHASQVYVTNRVCFGVYPVAHAVPSDVITDCWLRLAPSSLC